MDLTIKSHTFNSINPGKKLLVTGAVHGNEICGVKACERLIEKIQNGTLELKEGSVTFIPICNPLAYKNKKRFFEVNLNRVMTKHNNPTLYEEKLANVLTDYIKMADYHLDIHSLHTNGTPFSFEDYPEQREFAEIQGLEYIFIGWPSIYKDCETVKDFSTQSYSHEVGTINTTVECGSHLDENSIDVAEKCILRSMKYLGMIEYEERINIIQKNVVMKKIVFKIKEGKLIENKKNLDPFQKGDILIHYNDGTELRADDDYIILFPKYDAIIGEEWFYLGKYET